jgi:flagellar motor switch protein FliG
MADKTIVLTFYGKDDTVESVSVSLFNRESNNYYYNEEYPAKEHCSSINSLELKDNRWIYSQVIKENKRVYVKKPLQFDAINRLSGRDLQLVIRETDNIDLVRAIKGTDEETKEKLFKNMSKHAAAVLKEDIEAAHGIGEDEISISKMKIIGIIERLSANGNINNAELVVLPSDGGTNE